MRPRIVLDCDPGVDDMFAIFTALRFCDVAGIVSVAGNVGIEHTTQNALDIVALAGAETPVFRGAAGPLNGDESDDAAHVHGNGGLGGVTLPTSSRAVEDLDGAQALLELTSTSETSVVAIGPLTNVAIALQRDPSWAERVPRLVLMGGSTDVGNVTATAEYNIWADPEAAAVVFDSGIAITMAGLNLTRQVTMGQTEIDQLRASNTPTSVAAADALDFYSDFAHRTYGNKESAMHDPCAVLDVVRPELFTRQTMPVTVETEGLHTRGMTICDQRPQADPSTTEVLLTADREQVVSLIVAAAIDPA